MGVGSGLLVGLLESWFSSCITAGDAKAAWNGAVSLAGERELALAL